MGISREQFDAFMAKHEGAPPANTGPVSPGYGTVHKWRVMAHRTAGSVCGAATAQLKGGMGQPMWFDTQAAAMQVAKHYNEQCTSRNVFYTVEEYRGH